MQFVSHLFAENVWPLIWVIALAELILLIAVVGTGRGKLLTWMGVLAFLAVFLVGLDSNEGTPCADDSEQLLCGGSAQPGGVI
jgi:hypothetical protein